MKTMNHRHGAVGLGIWLGVLAGSGPAWANASAEVETPSRPPAGQISGEGRRISLNFQDIEVRALLQLIADFSQFNIVSSDAVRGKITVRMRDMPWEQALDAILQTKGLAMVQRGPNRQPEGRSYRPGTTPAIVARRAPCALRSGMAASSAAV